jgi:hypothetical protein
MQILCLLILEICGGSMVWIIDAEHVQADFAPEFLRGLPALDDQKTFEKQRTG